MKRSCLSFFRWPVRYFPVYREAGRFPMTSAINALHPTFALHLHEYAGKLQIGSKAIRLQPGDITLSPPQVQSRYILAEGGMHFCIHFEPAISKGKAVGLPIHFRPGAQVVAARERFWRVIDYVRQAREDKNSTYGAAASVALQELLLWIHLQGFLPRFSFRRSRAEALLASVPQIIDASLAKPISVPDLAKQAGISAGHLSRLFNRAYGMSIPRYVLLRRMELARHLVRSTTLPIREIGRQAGIPDPQYFNKLFRNVVGESPSRYRLRASAS